MICSFVWVHFSSLLKIAWKVLCSLSFFYLSLIYCVTFRSDQSQNSPNKAQFTPLHPLKFTHSSEYNSSLSPPLETGNIKDGIWLLFLKASLSWKKVWQCSRSPIVHLLWNGSLVLISSSNEVLKELQISLDIVIKSLATLSSDVSNWKLHGFPSATPPLVSINS